MEVINVEILGSKWEICIKRESEDKRLADADGFMDWTNKEIVVANRMGEGTLKHPLVYMCKVMRHEIVHAFMRESGLAENMYWGIMSEEMVVDWIAIQMKKMHKVCEKAEDEVIRRMCG